MVRRRGRLLPVVAPRRRRSAPPLLLVLLRGDADPGRGAVCEEGMGSPSRVPCGDPHGIVAVVPRVLPGAGHRAPPFLPPAAGAAQRPLPGPVSPRGHPGGRVDDARRVPERPRARLDDRDRDVLAPAPADVPDRRGPVAGMRAGDDGAALSLRGGRGGVGGDPAHRRLRRPGPPPGLGPQGYRSNVVKTVAVTSCLPWGARRVWPRRRRGRRAPRRPAWAPPRAWPPPPTPRRPRSSRCRRPSCAG